MLADVIHDQMCDRRPRPEMKCLAYERMTGGHWEFYQTRAWAVWAALEPEIGEANVEFAVRVILEELL
jgi:hypothetical protein